MTNINEKIEAGINAIRTENPAMFNELDNLIITPEDTAYMQSLYSKAIEHGWVDKIYSSLATMAQFDEPKSEEAVASAAVAEAKNFFDEMYNMYVSIRDHLASGGVDIKNVKCETFHHLVMEHKDHHSLAMTLFAETLVLEDFDESKFVNATPLKLAFMRVKLIHSLTTGLKKLTNVMVSIPAHRWAQ